MDKNKKTKYVAHPVDKNGIAHYSAEENSVWQTLITRQTPIVQTRACEEYLHGLTRLQLPTDHVPQCPDISSQLQATTGWSLAPVPALIPADQFFELLSKRQFPAATFIRHRDELDYLQEPDIFHEIFGHCPMLTNPACADFTQQYGQLALTASQEDRIMLARLYWFTIEFGLIMTQHGLRIYGGGILSSKNETVYALENTKRIIKPFDPIEVLRTPYRIDIMQPIYFAIDSFDVLFELLEIDLIALIKKARQQGMHTPAYHD
jgi:phenylalanine-4-hydroxylase